MSLQKSNGQKSAFETTKQINPDGREFWSARDFQLILEYREWRKFLGVIEKAREACTNSGQLAVDHFVQVDKMVGIGSGAERSLEDYQLSRYACYLIVQNADPAKSVVALGQNWTICDGVTPLCSKPWL